MRTQKVEIQTKNPLGGVVRTAETGPVGPASWRTPEPLDVHGWQILPILLYNLICRTETPLVSAKATHLMSISSLHTIRDFLRLTF